MDRIYMMFVQATTGGGGWPMSVWLTPELKPFFGGTYFPPDNRYGRPGFKTVLEYIANVWQTDRAKIAESSVDIVEQLEQARRGNRRSTAGCARARFGLSGLPAHVRCKARRLRRAPKFPRPVLQISCCATIAQAEMTKRWRW